MRWIAIATTIVTPWIVAAALPRRWAAWLVPAAVLIVMPIADEYVNLFGPASRLAPAEAWRMLFRATALTAILAYVARVGSQLLRRWSTATTALAAFTILAGATFATVRWNRWMTLPTDALEARVFAPILQALPRNSTVFSLSVSGSMSDELPLYDRCTRGGPLRHELDAGQPPSAIVAGDYWFHAAPCSTTQGRPYCDAVESRLVLRPIHVEHLPARQSLDYLPYDRHDIVSGLYRVEALRN